MAPIQTNATTALELEHTSMAEHGHGLEIVMGQGQTRLDVTDGDFSDFFRVLSKENKRETDTETERERERSTVYIPSEVNRPHPPRRQL